MGGMNAVGSFVARAFRRCASLAASAQWEVDAAGLLHQVKVSSAALAATQIPAAIGTACWDLARLMPRMSRRLMVKQFMLRLMRSISKLDADAICASDAIFAWDDSFDFAVSHRSAWLWGVAFAEVWHFHVWT